MPSPAQRVVAETLGTAFLLATVIGSGIMAQRLSGGNDALALLCNTLPTGAILTVLILIFGPVSGAHFNPAVTLAFALRGELPWPMACMYLAAQVSGAIIGVWAAHLMFELPVWQFSTHVRTGPGQWFAEAVATFGLVLTIFGCVARTPQFGRVRGGSLHYGSLLVHCLDIFCKSGGDHRAFAVRHLRRHRASRRACICPRATSRCHRLHGAGTVALASSEG